MSAAAFKSCATTPVDHTEKATTAPGAARWKSASMARRVAGVDWGPKTETTVSDSASGASSRVSARSSSPTLAQTASPCALRAASQRACMSATVGRSGAGCWESDGRMYFDATEGGKPDVPGASGTATSELGQIFEYDPRRELLTLLFASPRPQVLQNPDNLVIVPGTGDIFVKTAPPSNTCAASLGAVRSTTSRARSSTPASSAAAALRRTGRRSSSTKPHD